MALWVVKSRPVPIYLIQPEWQTGTKICSSFVLTYLFLTFLSYIRNLQWFLYFKVLRELQPSKGLAKGPIRRNNIVGDESAPALVVTLKERLCPLWQGLLCQFWSQLLDMGNQPVFDPLIEAEWASPAPPTVVNRRRLKYEWPLIVTLMPPLFLHGTL